MDRQQHWQCKHEDYRRLCLRILKSCITRTLGIKVRRNNNCLRLKHIRRRGKIHASIICLSRLLFLNILQMKLRVHQHTYSYNWKSATTYNPRIDTDKKNPLVDRINNYMETRANESAAIKAWAAKKKNIVQKIASLGNNNKKRKYWSVQSN